MKTGLTLTVIATIFAAIGHYSGEPSPPENMMGLSMMFLFLGLGVMLGVTLGPAIEELKK